MSAMPKGPAVCPDPAATSISIMVCRISKAFDSSCFTSVSDNALIRQLYRDFRGKRRAPAHRALQDIRVRHFGLSAFSKHMPDHEPIRASADEFLYRTFGNSAVDGNHHVRIF